MTLGEKISILRKERSLTQAELGRELGVTYQAVSKWERDESMPDFEMISKLAKLFGVPIAHFENKVDGEEETLRGDESVEPTAEPISNILGVCTVCGKYIRKDNLGVETPRLVCKPCKDEQIAQNERARQVAIQKTEIERQSSASAFKKRTIIASIVAGVISIIFFVLSMIGLSDKSTPLEIGEGEYIATAVIMFILLFTWVFQLFFDGAVRSVTLAGMFFIKLPGIIFTADLDGLIFLIVMKVLFFIISAIVFIGAIIVTSLVAMVVSLFTFIPILIKISRRNEDIL